MSTAFFKSPRFLVPASVAALAAPVWLLCRSGDAGFAPVRFLFSGAAFAERPIVIGGALDQFSLQKELFILGYSLVVLCPCIALVRRLHRHSGRGVRRLFAGCSLVLLVHPLSILAIFACDVSRYLLRMGCTSRRLAGLALALVVFAALALFAAWVAGYSRRPPSGAGG